MAEHSLFNVAVQAEQLRNAQKAWRQQLIRYRITETDQDLDLVEELENILDNLEQSFDDTIAQIINSK